MRIFSISSVYANDKKKEEYNRKRIIEWILSDEVGNILNQQGFSREDVLPPDIASRDDTFEIVSAEGIHYPYSNMVSKGVAVRNKLLRIKKNYEIQDDDIIIYFDGDGQIISEDILNCIEKLKTSDYVIAKRNGWFGISSERTTVELFENFLVEKNFNTELLDAQCGLWGFKGKYLEDLWNNLSAIGFEIELDILIYFLSRGIHPNYVDCTIIENGKEQTTYVPKDDHWKKALYTMKKFDLNHTKLLATMQLFSKETGKLLPQSYISLLGSNPEIIKLNN